VRAAEETAKATNTSAPRALYAGLEDPSSAPPENETEIAFVEVGPEVRRTAITLGKGNLFWVAGVVQGPRTWALADSGAAE
jgi:acyl-coenzyme A thioesterase PaaI-like protein